MASQLLGAKVITGELRSALLVVNKLANAEDEAAIDSTDRSYTKHLINPKDPGITVIFVKINF